MKITINGCNKMSVYKNDKLYVESTGFLLVWRYEGESEWRIDKADSTNIDGNILTSYFSDNKVIVEILEKDYGFLMRGKLLAGKNIELARFHYIDGVTKGKPNFYAMSVFGLNSRTFRPDEELPSPLDFVDQLNWRQWGVNWERLNDPIHMLPNTAVSTDLGCFIFDDNCLTVAYTGPGNAFGEIGFGTCKEQNSIYSAVLLDNILLCAGKERVLEECMLSFKPMDDALKIWAVECANILGSRVHEYSISGYCSWYQQIYNITKEHFYDAIDDFSKMPTTPGGKVIQLDDGFQIMPGDWRPNLRFEKVWDELPSCIDKKGAIPGIWLAPTTIYSGHDLVKNKSDMLQKMTDGSPAVTFSNWNWSENYVDENHHGDGSTWYLEPDHPESKEFIKKIIKDAVNQGFKYIKFDFSYAISTARVAYDRSKTMFETLRDLWAFYREAAGEDILLCACAGGNHRYVLGTVDTSRIGGDNGSEYESIKTNLPDFLRRAFTHGIWWNVDPDVFYMREENSSLTMEENWLLTATIGLLGCCFITSDLTRQWGKEQMDRVKLFWNENGLRVPEDMRVFWDEDGKPLGVFVKYADRKIRIAIYNFSDEDRDISLLVESIDLPKNNMKLQTYEGDIEVILEKDVLRTKNQPRHSIRIVEL